MKKSIGILLCLVMMLTLFVGCGTSDSTSSDSPSDSSSPAGSTEKYKIGVSNSFLGNDWRQIMIKCLQVAVETEPYKSEVELTINNCEQSDEAQIASLNAMIEQGYDAIIVDANSTGIKSTLENAIEAGIVIVSFDSTVQVDGGYTVATDFVAMAEAWAEYLCQKVGDGANIAMDIGMAGTTNGNAIYDAAKAVFTEHNMNIVSEFNSDYSDGVCQTNLATVLSSFDVDAVFCQAYVESCVAVMDQLKMDYIPISAFDTNLGMYTTLSKDLDAVIGNNCPGQGVVAMDIALRVLKGETVDAETLMIPGIFVNSKDADMTISDSLELETIQLDVNCWNDPTLNGMDWPLFPPGFDTISLDISQVSDYQK